jgi:hypothetical protein
MANLKLYSALPMLLLMYACTNGESNQQTTVFKKQPELQMIRPQKPVNIKLKRNASGSYSWEVKGNDADKVLEADEKLRKSLDKE